MYEEGEEIFDDEECQCIHCGEDIPFEDNFCSKACERKYTELLRENAEYTQLCGEPDETPSLERHRPSEY